MKLTMFYRAQIIIETYTGWLEKRIKVLDLGCGSGVVSRGIEKHFKIKLTGCDIEDRLEVTMSFKKMINPDKLPFEDKSFDVVMINDTLHHCTKEAQIALLREAKRVAKKTLIFEDEPYPFIELMDVLVNFIHYQGLGLTLNFRSESEWKKVFKNLGFKCQSKKVETPFFYPFPHLAFYLT